VYFLATIEDHIAPWKTTYAGAQFFSGPVRFVLSGSGHIAGVINPPANGKYCHWLNPAIPKTSERWFGGAEQQQGSWWVDWLQWAQQYAGEPVPARVPGTDKMEVIEDAPGSYVRVQIGK
jgi:polyhydroxyalkanoate synthase